MQPYLLPYAGYFQLMMAADKFVLLDDVAYINKGWINRNRIIINGEAQYFTVPLQGASQNKRINETSLLSEEKWKIKLEKTVEMAYKKAPFFKDVFPVFQSVINYPETNLSAWLYHSFTAILAYLNKESNIVASSSIYQNDHLKAQDRIIDICTREKTGFYINPPGGKALYNEDDFRLAGMQLKFLKPVLAPYTQTGTKQFIPGLSILDLIMNTDKENALTYLANYELE